MFFFLFFVQVYAGEIEASRKNCDEINTEFKSKNCTKSFARDEYTVFPIGKRWKQEFNITGQKVLWEEAMLTDCPVVQSRIKFMR